MVDNQTLLLNDFQQNFKQFLVKQHKSEVLFEHCIKSSRLNIYYQAYRSRLINVLKEDYPKLALILGDEPFEKLTYQYLTAHPSKYYSAADFGQQLPYFLSITQPFSRQQALEEMAYFEQALGSALTEKDKQPLTINSLQQVIPEQWVNLRLEFHPSVQLFDSYFNTPMIWQALDKQPEQIISPPAKNEFSTAWLIWRKSLKSYYLSLSPVEHKAFCYLQEGHSFGQLCEMLCEYLTSQEIPKMSIKWLQNWFNEEMIVGLQYLKN